MTLGGSLFGELVDDLGWLGNPLFGVEDFYRDDVPLIVVVDDDAVFCLIAFFNGSFPRE
jgi:hypothetical protein